MTDPTVGPRYGGSADPGMRSSLPEDSPALGDVVDVLGAEHRKLESLLGTLVAIAEQGPREDLQQRWYGAVRELLEFETAEERVVWPEVGDEGPLGEEHQRQRQLVERLSQQDEMLDREVDPREVIDLSSLAVEHIRGERKVLVPALQGLDPDLRQRLGEDVRQVMG